MEMKHIKGSGGGGCRDRGRSGATIDAAANVGCELDVRMVTEQVLR